MARLKKLIVFLVLINVCILWHGLTPSYASFSEMSPVEQSAWTDFTSKNQIALKQSLIKLAQQEPTSNVIHAYGAAFYFYDQEFSDRIVKILNTYLKKQPHNVQVNDTIGCILLDNSIPITGELAVAQLRHWYSIPPEQNLPASLRREDALSGIAHLEQALKYSTDKTDKGLVSSMLRWLLRGYLDLGEYDKGIATVDMALKRFSDLDKMHLLYYQAKYFKEKKQFDKAYSVLRKALKYKDEKPPPVDLLMGLQYTYDALGQICLEQGKISEARYWMQQLADLPYIAQIAPMTLATGLMEKGYYQEVRKYYDTLNRSSAQIGSPTVQWLYEKLQKFYK